MPPSILSILSNWRASGESKRTINGKQYIALPISMKKGHMRIAEIVGDYDVNKKTWMTDFLKDIGIQDEEVIAYVVKHSIKCSLEGR